MYICTGNENNLYMKPRKHNINQSIVTTIQPVSIISSAKHIAPTLVTPGQGIKVNLHNLYTGRILTIGHKAATRLTTKYPDEYKLIKP